MADLAAITNLRNLQLVNQGLQQVTQVNDSLVARGITPGEWFASACGTAKRQEEEEPEVEDAGPVTDVQQKTYLLRICIHSAENLPREKAYVVTTIGEGDRERKDTTELSEESGQPVWEHCLDQDVTFSDRPPSVQLKIFGKRSLQIKDRLLGTASFRLPHTASDGPKRQLLKLSTPQGLLQSCAQCRPPQTPMLHIVWQLCEPSAVDFRPDLNRVAEMDQTAIEKETQVVEAKVLGLFLRRHEAQKKVNVTLKLKRPDNDPLRQLPTRSTPTALTWPKGEAYTKMQLAFQPAQAKDLFGCVEACWSGQDAQQDDLGWEIEPWTVRESEMILLSYFLEVTVYETVRMEPEGNFRRGQMVEKPVKLGSWREPLGDIMDAIDQQDQRLRFDAELISRDSQNVGRLRLEVDVFTDQRHRSPPLASKDRATVAIPSMSATTELSSAASLVTSLRLKVPIRRGMPTQDLWLQKVSYHCTVFADGLPNLDRCHPYVKVTITGAGGTSSVQTDAKTEHQVNNIGWMPSLLLTTRLINRKARVELYNSNTQGNFLSSSLGLAPQGDLLGEATIYDVGVDKEYWLHMYGGAFNAPKQDVASCMVKGAVRPPSTYQGTVVVHFGSRRQSQNYFQKLANQREERRLVVRMYSGVNLRHYAQPGRKRRVKVLFQLAGCRIPDDRELYRREQEQRRKAAKSDADPGEETTVCCGTGEEFGDLSLDSRQVGEKPDPTHFNRNLLSFPAEVDEMGVLRFKDTKRAKTGSWNTKAEPNCRWVERRTPKDFPLLVPPAVMYAYCYIVADGEEMRPPEVFGRFRLHEKEPCEVGPKWKRLRYDTSVCDPPESHFNANIAGFLLGSVALISENTRGYGHRETNNNKMIGLSKERDVVELQQMLPRSTRGTFFPCCVADQQVNVGSLGEPDEVECEPERPENRRKVYCHIDVLAARELPAMDDDGLIDPCYRIEVLDNEITQPGGMSKSMSPSFMHRVVIPLEIEVEEGDNPNTMVSTNIPMPPVILRILDFDERRLFGQAVGGEFEEAGCVVVKHEAGRDGKFRMLGYEKSKVMYNPDPLGGEWIGGAPDEQMPLDLNSIHEAVWHALDKPARTRFDAAAGGVDMSWIQRPRLLLAVGYSMQKEVLEYAPRVLVKSPDYFKSSMRRDGEITMLHTEESACFQIDINLLGLRNLPTGVYNAKLLVSSFWQGAPVEFDIGSGFLGLHDHNPTFPQDGWEHSEENELQSHKTYFSVVLNWTTEPDLGLIYTEQDTEPGLLVIAVTANSVAGAYNECQGPEGWTIQPGDVILKVNGQSAAIYEKLKRGTKMEMLFVRGQAWKAFAHQVKDIIKVFQGHDAPLEEEEHMLPFVFLEELKGVKIQAPIYRVPVIPYLQRDHRVDGGIFGPSPSSMNKSSLTTLSADESQEPFVLLPAIIFQLKNFVAGTDYGTMTVGLNRLNRDSPFRTSWIDMVLKEYQTLPRELKAWSYKEKDEIVRGSIVGIKGMRIDEDAYSVFVDVFTTQSGYLTFDPDMRIGRPLSEQRLFSISKSRLNVDKEREIMQFFNPADFMSGNSVFASEPYDSRVTPSLWCGKFDGEDIWERRWLVPEAQVAEYCTPRRELKLNKPKGPSELLQDIFGGVMEKAANHTIRGARAGEKVKICNCRTGELRKELKRDGWRGTSHLIAPETDQEKNALFTDLIRSGGLSRNALKANLHTFVRPVGHIIHDSDRDSHFLARLRMSVPTEYMADIKRRLERDKEELEKYMQNMEQSDKGEVNDDEEELVRLQKSIEFHELRLQNAMKAERATCNFLVVKFRKRGMVIWSAPNHVYNWPKPGVPLFVVQLTDRQDVKVPVFVPSFDIRFQFETTWTPVKTLLQRWRHMENRIHVSDKKGMRGGQPGPESLEKKRKRRRQQVPLAAHDLEEGSDDSSADEVTDTDICDPNGYSRAIAVSKYAFVCRIRRRRGAICFDRVQTRNWYSAVLEDTFGADHVPSRSEISRASAMQDDSVKEQYLANFMNLEKPLVTRLEQNGVATLKGHITCQRVKDPHPEKEAAFGESGLRGISSARDYSSPGLQPLALCTAPSQVQANTRAVENLWVQRRVFVDCCVLTGSDLELQSLGLSSCLKPFLVVKLGDEMPGQSDPTEEVTRQGSSCANFYNTFVFETTLPGQAKMTVEVWHKGVLSNTLIGITEIDLEDRWLALKRRELRESSYSEYLRNCISPERVRFCPFQPTLEMSGWVDPPAEPEADCSSPGVGKEPLKPSRAVSHRMPIEYRDLMRVDGETATESRAGVLRLWVDITPIGEHSPGDIEVFKPQEFQVRIIIWRINNISVFKDFGDRNDVYVKGRFKYVDFWGKEHVKVDKTDTHKFANAEAYFNWRWNFTVRAPSTDCFLELTMMDEDRISQHDTIYYPVVYSLDQMLNVAYSNAKDGRRPLGTLQETVVFDQYDEENAVENCCARYCRRCWRRARLRDRKFAKMRMDVQILPMEEAMASPVDTGSIMPPKDRLTISTAISHPERTLQIIMGARNYYNVTYFSIFCFVLILLLLIAALCYFLLNIGTLFKSAGSSAGR